MKIYVIRHGETDWNLKRKIQGNTDVELNKNGIEQAKKLKNILETYNIDIIISSPLKRARKTAEIINESIKCTIIFNENLRERGYGEFEGSAIEVLEKDEIIKSGALHNYFINKKYKGVEPIKDIFNRVKQTIDELKSEYKDKNILLVTHGATIAVIEACLNGIGEDGKIDKSNTKNCEIKTFYC